MNYPFVDKFMYLIWRKSTCNISGKVLALHLGLPLNNLGLMDEIKRGVLKKMEHISEILPVLQFFNYVLLFSSCKKMKFVVLTGDTTGIGKTFFGSGVGHLLKHQGHEVTAIKIDNLLNIDFSTVDPYEYGEIFVLRDGGQVSCDLGGYERVLDVSLQQQCHITRGKIFQYMRESSRNDVVSSIKDVIVSASKISVSSNGREPDICIIEFGASFYDMECIPFLQAFQEIKREVTGFCYIHIISIPQFQPKWRSSCSYGIIRNRIDELKFLRFSPDIIVCRTTYRIENLGEYSPKQVLFLHNIEAEFFKPNSEQSDPISILYNKLKIPEKYGSIGCSYQHEAASVISQKMEIFNISVVDEKCVLSTHFSLREAIFHAAVYCNLKINLKCVDASELKHDMLQENEIAYNNAWGILKDSDGVIVPGAFNLKENIEGQLLAIEWARTHKKPFLGIALGFHYAILEYARSVLGLDDASILKISPDEKIIKNYGSRRIGIQKVIFTTQDSICWRLYNRVDAIEERCSHHFEINSSYLKAFEMSTMKFIAEDEISKQPEILEINSSTKIGGYYSSASNT